jgi:hypothetical protein
MDENSTAYTTASGIWRRGGVIKILSILDTIIASFPLDVVREGGDNTWRYISLVTNLLVEDDPDHPGHIENQDGTVVDVDDAPSSGIFRYVEQGIYDHWDTESWTDDTTAGKASDVVLSRAPQYFSSVTAPSGIEESTRSASSEATRSRPDQVSEFTLVTGILIGQINFRELLIARDNTCLVTGYFPADCVAAHIVPASRPDVSLHIYN